MGPMKTQRFTTPSNIEVHYQKKPIDVSTLDHITKKLDQYKGVMLSSGIDYPGRYNRWELGTFNPPCEIIAYKEHVEFIALNPRGEVILALFKPVFMANNINIVTEQKDKLIFSISRTNQIFSEEDRSKQPSAVSILRLINLEMDKLKDNMLGLFGAFGYDLIFEFEPCELQQKRDNQNKIYHLFFVDKAYAIDKQKEAAFELSVEFMKESLTTIGQSSEPFYTLKQQNTPFKAESDIQVSLSDQEYAELVKSAKKEMKKGNIFEVVYSRHFHAKVSGKPSELYHTLKEMNPSPYEFYCQLGDEQIIGTSPEMFVRCEGKTVESCPISGTITRGKNAMEDEMQIRKLLNSYKDEVELTMCTDVDRNDKARICEADSIELISRRTIERYTGLFHTVDHVKGQLREGYNGLDAFLSHMWAVTLTGSPKKRAIELIEKNENQSRKWYGGSIGCLGFNGDMNSTITIRTVYLTNNHAYYQSGATLVWDSNPLDEAKETITKATTFYRALNLKKAPSKEDSKLSRFDGLYAIMIDYEDSFVHTLASYFRKLGVILETYRFDAISTKEIIDKKPDLVIHSPGPGRPSDFDLATKIQKIADQGIAQFGVCLGLQGIIEAFGGKLQLLDEPKHGKIWKLKHHNHPLFSGIDIDSDVAAYHSLIADGEHIPSKIEVIATNEKDDIMAISHKELPILAVQFHPESILTLHNDTGIKLIANALSYLKA